MLTRKAKIYGFGLMKEPFRRLGSVSGRSPMREKPAQF